MPRRPDKGFDLLASLPWPVGLLIGLGAYLAIRYLIPSQMGQAHGALGELFTSGAALRTLNWIAWGMLGICWLAAGASYFDRRKKSPPDDNTSTADNELPAVCRDCGSPVTMQRDSVTGEAHMECSRYPTCRETMPLED